MEWTVNNIVAILAALGTLGNTAWIIYSAYKKNKPEVKKLEGEAESELQEATNLNLTGAKISAEILLDRINELKGELDTERRLRKEEQAFAEKAHKESMEVMERNYKSAIEDMEKKRREDIEYFRRRIKELDRELRAYRSYAAKLSKQVVEAGKIPAPLIFGYNESDPSIQAIRPDLEGDLEEDAQK